MKLKPPKRLSNQLRRIVIDCGLSRYEISRRAGIDKAVLSKFVHGTRGLSMETLDKLGACLGLNITMTGTPKPAKPRRRL